MNSIEITILRTGAATGVAAKYLARADAKTATIIGCGNQGSVSLSALLKVRPLENVYVFDIEKTMARAFAATLSRETKITVEAVNDIETALCQSQICIICSPSRQPFIKPEFIVPGTFIAAVGADTEDKQEIYPELPASNKVVTDLSSQCVNIGKLHHALQQKKMTITDVYAELGEIVAGQKKGRTSDDENIIFDSTGTALQDIAAAPVVYEKALSNSIGMKLNFGG